MFGPGDLLLPPIVLAVCIANLPITILILLLTNRVSELTSWHTLKHAWFVHFFWWFGPASKPIFAGTVRPLLDDAYGVVLDIGPANGTWMDELGRVAAAGGGGKKKISKIYGIEPNVLFHKQLLANAKRAGLEGIYEPVAAYAGELEGKGIKKGSIDTIITVHVLCSVGERVDRVVRELYDYLKPGGQWLVYEHVASKNAPVKAWQSVNNLVWGEVFDGCGLTSKTEAVIKRAGEWQSARLGPDPKEGYFETLPHVTGKLIK